MSNEQPDAQPTDDIIEEFEIDVSVDDETSAAVSDTGADTAAAVDGKQYGVGPFTIRELSILGAWLVAFVFSFFPVYAFSFLPRDDGGRSVWTSGIDWVLTIGVPTVAVFLLVLRRFSPGGIRRVGSLAIDQFASVAFTVAAVAWATLAWESVAVAIASGGGWITTWVLWVELVAAFALVVLSVFAPIIPPFNEDFQDRPEVAAHRNARPVRAVVARPRAPRLERPTTEHDGQAAPAYDGAGFAAPGYDTGAYAASDTGAYAANETGAYAANDTGAYAANDTGAYAAANAFAPVDDSATAGDAFAPAGGETGPVEDWSAAGPAYARSGAGEPEPAVSHQPFWALAPVERDVVDEQTGAPLFRIGPTAWALVVADRGSSFLVRHDDGRVGVLYDVSGVTRG